MMSIAQSGFTVNFPHMIGEQAKHIAYVISCGLARGLRRLEVSAEAEAEWVDAVLQHSGMTQEFSQNCTPGYYNNEGQPSETSRQNGFYFGGPTEFVKILEDWRADGSLKGLVLR
jgi:cyclohexanone monooxygenase